jgi:hypothetical protein
VPWASAVILKINYKNDQHHINIWLRKLDYKDIIYIGRNKIIIHLFLISSPGYNEGSLQHFKQ